MNPGKRFEGSFHESLHALPGASMRVLDGGKSINIRVWGDFLYFADDGHVWLFECKSTALRSLPFLQVKEHQLESLSRFDSLHDHFHGVIAVNFYDGDNVRRKNDCWLVPVSDYMEFVKHSGRKSMPEGSIGIPCAPINDPSKKAKWVLPLDDIGGLV